MTGRRNQGNLGSVFFVWVFGLGGNLVFLPSSMVVVCVSCLRAVYSPFLVFILLYFTRHATANLKKRKMMFYKPSCPRSFLPMFHTTLLSCSDALRFVFFPVWALSLVWIGLLRRSSVAGCFGLEPFAMLQRAQPACPGRSQRCHFTVRRSKLKLATVPLLVSQTRLGRVNAAKIHTSISSVIRRSYTGNGKVLLTYSSKFPSPVTNKPC